MYKIIFFGTSEFAVPSLRALVDDGRFEMTGVVTRSDKPVGRGGKITAPPVKDAALELGIQIIKQPERLKEVEFKSWIETIGKECDAFVIVAYGKILPEWLIDLPKKGIVNVHGSLLPRWRGPSPIQTAIAEGDTRTGVTIMKINERMDEGPILESEATEIRPDETGGELHDRLAKLGAQILPFVLAGYFDGTIVPRAQDDAQATVCKMLSREDGRIDWNQDAEVIKRKIRAYQPWPGAWMELDGNRIKILKAEIAEFDKSANPGTLLTIDGSPAVATKNNKAIKIILLQPESKRAMSGVEYSKGAKNNFRLN